jgi:hypothetical protein
MRRASLGVGSRAAIILLPVHPANRRLVALALPAALRVADRWAWGSGIKSSFRAREHGRAGTTALRVPVAPLSHVTGDTVG